MNARIDSARLTKVAVLHEDDTLLVVLKPAGLAVHGGAGEKKQTLIHLLEGAYADPNTHLHLVHRLDKATAGVMIVAKQPQTQRVLSASWESTEKIYVALAFGHIDETLTLTAPIPDKHQQRQSALSIVEPIERSTIGPKTTLVRVTIHTGRTHQIRQHLAGARHPVVLDDKYGDFGANKEIVKALRSAEVSRPRHLFLASTQIGLPDGRVFEGALPASWRVSLAAAGIAVDELAFVS